VIAKIKGVVFLNTLFCELSGVKTASPPVSAAVAAAVEDGIRINDSDVVLVGLAVSWENRDAYYVALTDTAAKGLFCIL